jgi:hypothetical protein
MNDPIVSEVHQSGAFVDAGSGHTGIIFYSTRVNGSVSQVLKDSIKNATGNNLTLTEVLTDGSPKAFDEFISQLQQTLDTAKNNMDFQPTLLYVGATGGLRDAIENDIISSADVDAFRNVLEKTFRESHYPIRDVRLVVLDGTQEALYETDAAQTIWSFQRSSMFPASSELSIGLFSGGGQSMQLGRLNEIPLSFPFSTFNNDFEEKHGAHPDAWLLDNLWNQYENNLKIKIQNESKKHINKFNGNYVCTAMNHRAAMYCQFSEKPIKCSEAIVILKNGLLQFRSQNGPLYDNMMQTASGSSARSGYPLARITACHTLRLCLTLENLFHSNAQLYFSRNGYDIDGKSIECEWTLGAYMECCTKK